MSAKKKVFVSIPMKGRTDEEIKKEMKMVFDQMYNSEEYELIDTVHRVEGGRVATFAESIRKLAAADVCCFAPGWEDAGGCLIEKMICDHFDVPQEFYKHPEKQIDKMVVMDEYDNQRSVNWLVKQLARYPKDYLYTFKGVNTTLLGKVDHYHRVITFGDREEIEQDILKEEYPDFEKNISWSSADEITSQPTTCVFSQIMQAGDDNETLVDRYSYLVVGKYVSEETAQEIIKKDDRFSVFKDEDEIFLYYIFAPDNRALFPLKVYVDPKYAPNDFIFIGTCISPVKTFNGISSNLNTPLACLFRRFDMNAIDTIRNIFIENVPHIRWEV